MGPPVNLPPEADESGPPPAGVLVVQNGRLSGVRRALVTPLTVLGRGPDCDVSLVLYRPPERIACHHCGAESPAPVLCPACRSALRLAFSLIRARIVLEVVERCEWAKAHFFVGRRFF